MLLKISVNFKEKTLIFSSADPGSGSASKLNEFLITDRNILTTSWMIDWCTDEKCTYNMIPGYDNIMRVMNLIYSGNQKTIK